MMQERGKREGQKCLRKDVLLGWKERGTEDAGGKEDGEKERPEGKWEEGKYGERNITKNYYWIISRWRNETGNVNKNAS